MNFKELINDYIENGATKVLSEMSKKSYLSRLPIIERYFINQFGKADHTTLTVSNIRNFQRWRDPQVGSVQKEKEARIFSIMIARGVKNFLISQDFSDQIYKYKVAQTKKSRTIIDPDKLEQILDAAQKYLTPIKYLAFYLSHVLMLRPAELLSLTLEDIDFDNKLIRVQGTKNEDADAMLPLSDKAIKLLLNGVDKKGKIFPYSYAWLLKIYQYLEDYVGLIGKDITPHKARKNMATFYVAKGIDIKTVQTLGRWKNPKVLLEIYAQSTPKQMTNAVNLI
jgi:integrase